MISCCRCCKNSLPKLPVMTYGNMPGRAQNFPVFGELSGEKGVDLALYQCPYCGLIQLSNDPVDYFRDVIRAVAVSEDMRQFRREYFKEFVTRFGLEKKRIIEIGAGCGEFVEVMKQSCCDVTGLEHRKESVESGRRQGLSMIQGFIETFDTYIEGAPFDGFYTMNFLEHIPEPNSFLQGVGANLTEDGVGLVEVPNMDFFMKNHLFAEFMLDHLSYFTRDTLRILLEKNGFDVLDCRTVWKDYVISAFVKKKKSADFSEFIGCQERLTGEIRNFLEREKAAGRKTAVWGAGHEALALLAMAKIGEEVEFVADSAKFKQGKYTPASHIPVVSPERIREEGIDSVLIMAGSYTEEVSAILKKSYSIVSAAAVESNGVRQLWKNM